MGIMNLLPLLSTITQPRNIKHMRGCTAGIDAHVWLHRSIHISPDSESSGSSHLSYFSRRAQSFVDYGVKPVFVFDGADLPAKRLTNRNRMSDRSVSLARAVSLKESGDFSAARGHLVQATEVSEDIVLKLVSDLGTLGYTAVVAPYEADAQLAFLAKSGLVDLVITEDSDLLVYECPRTWFKFDHDTGFALEVTGPISRTDALTSLSPDGVTVACILAGCDYGPRLPGIGIRRAIQIVRDSDIQEFTAVQAHLVLRELKSRNIEVRNEDRLISSLISSYLVFRHQTVFNPHTSSLQPLNSFGPKEPLSTEQLHLLGPIYCDLTACHRYRGLPESFSRKQDISVRTPSIQRTFM